MYGRRLYPFILSWNQNLNSNMGCNVDIYENFQIKILNSHILNINTRWHDSTYCQLVWFVCVCVCVCGVCVCVCVSWWVCVCRVGWWQTVEACVYLYMHFVALLDHHISKMKVFREKRLHLKCSPDRYLLIKPLTKKIKRVVKEKNHFENWQVWMNVAFCGTFGQS